MFLFVSREPMTQFSSTDVDRALSATPTARVVQALLDTDRASRQSEQSVNNAVEFRDAAEQRLAAIHELTAVVRARDARVAQLELVAQERLDALEKTSAALKELREGAE